MLWNQPSAMAMVLTLATLIGGVLSTVSTLKQQSPSSNPVWLIDIVPLATNTGTDNATWVESVAGGQSYIVLAKDFPHPGQDVYISTIYNPRVRQDNLRIFSQEGKPLLNFDCGLVGALYTMVKTTQGQHWIVVSKYWSTDDADKNYLRLHQISSLSGEVTLTGKVISKLFLRVPLIADLPNTSYFFATSLIAVVRVSMFGSDDNLTDKIGKVSCYANFLEYFEEYDAVLTHFSYGKDLALIDRVTLKFIRTSVFQEIGYDVIFERPQQKNLYTLMRTGIEQSYVVKVQLSLDSDNLLVSTFRTAPLLFGFATLIDLPTLNALLVAPLHFHKSTTSAYFGRLLFISKRDFSVDLFGTKPSWSVQRMTQAVSQGSGDDHGMRLYVSFMDVVSNNLHFYYMLVDACLESDPTSSTCSHCPSGYWRLSPSFDPPRRCLKPADFPPVSGMDNSTSQIRPCQVSNCKECTYNLSSCTACDTSRGFYLDPNQSPPVCIPPEDFPKRFGLDASKTRVVGCSDPSCLMCSLSADECTACDKEVGMFLLGSVCLNSSRMPTGQGPDLQTGRVVQCVSKGCLNCETDSEVCQRCDPVSGWLLHSRLGKCKQTQELGPNEGRDLLTFKVVNCVEKSCSNCREDYRFCNSNIGPSGQLQVKRSRYSTKTKTALVSFNSPIYLMLEGNFWAEFSVWVQNDADGSKLSCQPSSDPASSLKCTEMVTRTGFQIQIDTKQEILSGKMLITHRNPDRNSLIFSTTTQAPFVGFPIVIEGVSTVKSPFFGPVSVMVSLAGMTRPYASILLAVVSHKTMMDLDRTFVHLLYLSLLEGATLRSAEQVFEGLLTPSNLLPEYLLPSRDRMSLFEPFSSCRASRVLANHDFECSLFANLKLDSVAIIIILTVSLSLTCLFSRSPETEPTNTTPRTSGASVKSFDAISNELNNSFPDMSNTSWKSGGSQKLAFVDEKSPEQSKGDENSKHQPKVSSEVATLSSARKSQKGRLSEYYGMNFFFAKLEACQLHILISVVLNFRHAGYSLLEQYSLIAAIIFTLYYIFQGYFTYQFASYIWKEVQTWQNLHFTPRSSVSSTNEEATSEPSSAKSIHPKPESCQRLRNICPDLLCGPGKHILAVSYSELNLPTKFAQLCQPKVYLVRSITLSLTLVMLTTVPLFQLSVALIVEIAYLVFIIKCSISGDKISRRIETAGQSCLCCYLLFKVLATLEIVGPSASQNTMGDLAALCLLVYPLLSFIQTSRVVVSFWKSNNKNSRDQRSNGSAASNNTTKQDDHKSELPGISTLPTSY